MNLKRHFIYLSIITLISYILFVRIGNVQAATIPQRMNTSLNSTLASNQILHTKNIAMSDISFNTGLTHFSDAQAWNMQTAVTLHVNTSTLEVDQMCQSRNWLTGFKGYSQVYLLDNNKTILWVSPAHELGVDGTILGDDRSYKNATSSDPVPATVTQNATQIVVVNFHDNAIETFLQRVLEIGQFSPDAAHLIRGAAGVLISGTIADLF